MNHDHKSPDQGNARIPDHSASRGHTRLSDLLRGMTPTLADDNYAFASLACDAIPPGLNAVMRFQEPEGTTVILSSRGSRAPSYFDNIPLSDDYPQCAFCP